MLSRKIFEEISLFSKESIYFIGVSQYNRLEEVFMKKRKSPKRSSL